MSQHARYQEAIKLFDQGYFSDYFKSMTSLAKEGYVPAQARIASAYFRGTGVEINVQRAFFWAKKAAMDNDVSAQYLMALLYRDHASEICNSPPQQAQADLLAVKWLKAAIKQGHPKAKVTLIYMQHEGRGIDKIDIHSAMAEYEKLKDDDNDGSAHYMLGALQFDQRVYREECYKHHYYSKARDYLAVAYARGNNYSANYLGHIYLEGLGVQIDYAKALGFFRTAAKLNYPYAITQLARMNELGWGTPDGHAAPHSYTQPSRPPEEEKAHQRTAPLSHEPEEPVTFDSQLLKAAQAKRKKLDLRFLAAAPLIQKESDAPTTAPVLS